jgi:hypothetical protein
MLGEYRKHLKAARVRWREITQAANPVTNARAKKDFRDLATFEELDENHRALFPSEKLEYYYDPKEDPLLIHAAITAEQNTVSLQSASELVKRLMQRETIKVLVPEFAVYPRCLFTRIRDYLGLKNLDIQTTDVSMTAIDTVNEGGDFDFIAAAAATMLIMGKEGARRFTYGIPLFILPQKAIVSTVDNVRWDRKEQIPFIFLAHATGHIQFLLTRHEMQKNGGPELFEPQPVSTLEKFFNALANNPARRTRAVSIWEPALSENEDKLPNQEELFTDAFEMALLVNCQRWRTDGQTVGEDEKDLYRLVVYVAEEFGLRAEELNGAMSKSPARSQAAATQA